MSILRRSLQREHGQAVVELALVLPFLILLLFGIIEAGRIYAAYQTVVAASREGARWATLGAPDDEIKARVQEAAPSLDAGLLDVKVEKGELGETTLVTVTVRYPVDVMLPVVGRLLPDPVVVAGRTKMRIA
ncbi:MAG: TadE family protein [Bacillota bacterium]